MPPLQSARLLDQVRERIRYLHYSLRTEQAYVHWVRAFVRYHGLHHPRTMGQVGYDIRTVQALRGHADVSTTMIYTHVRKVGGGAVRSPLDALGLMPGAGEPDAPYPAPEARQPCPPACLLPRSPATPSFTAAATSAS